MGGPHAVIKWQMKSSVAAEKFKAKGQKPPCVSFSDYRGGNRGAISVREIGFSEYSL